MPTAVQGIVHLKPGVSSCQLLIMYETLQFLSDCRLRNSSIPTSSLPLAFSALLHLGFSGKLEYISAPNSCLLLSYYIPIALPLLPLVMNFLYMQWSSFYLQTCKNGPRNSRCTLYLSTKTIKNRLNRKTMYCWLAGFFA